MGYRGDESCILKDRGWVYQLGESEWKLRVDRRYGKKGRVLPADSVETNEGRLELSVQKRRD